MLTQSGPQAARTSVPLALSPISPASNNGIDDSADRHDAEEGPSTKKRRIWAACEPCRKRKSRCNGQNPCSSCIGTVKAAASASAQLTKAEKEAIDWTSRAQQICVFDWNRKPRGPKGRKKAGAPGEEPTPLGAPRSQASAGQAYVAAQQKRNGSIADQANASETVRIARTKSATSSDQHYAATSPGSSPWNDSESRAFSSHLAHTSPPQGPRLPPLARGGPSPARAALASLSPDAARIQHLNHSNVENLADTSLSQSQNHHPMPTNKGPSWNDFNSSNGAPSSLPPPPLPPLTSSSRLSDSSSHSNHYDLAMGSSSSFLSMEPSRWGASSALDGIRHTVHHRSSSSSSVRPSTVASGASSAGRGNMGQSPGSPHPSGGLPAAYGSPRSEGSATRLTRGINISSPSSSSQMRYVDQNTLINRLRPYYSDDDRPFVAIAIAHFEGFDSLEKFVPSRYLFGQASGQPYREPPAHLLLALLALLGHRALLLPDDMNIEDLDLQAGEPVLRFANSSGRLEGEDRIQMLQFARRSWTLAYDLMLQKIRAGEVDHRLLQTGTLLDFGASEDGISSRSMANMKKWLLRLCFCWRLHQLDAKPGSPDAQGPWEGAEILQRSLEMTNEQELADDWPLPRVADSRHLTTDPIELEVVRRNVHYIYDSSFWVQTADMQLPRFDLQSLETDPPCADDFIHHGSNWTPKAQPSSQGFLQQTRALVFRLYSRVTRLLHTPLLDLCTGRSPEPDLQQAITEMETQLDWLKGRIGPVAYEGPEMPMRVAVFVHSRMCGVLMYRLGLAIQAFYAVFAPKTAAEAKPDPSLKIASTMMPRDEARSNFQRIAGESGVPVGDGEKARNVSGSDGQGENELGLIPRPQFTRHPMRACLDALYEIHSLVQRILFLHRARAVALDPMDTLARQTRTRSESEAGGDLAISADKVGTAAGVTMDALLRSVRFPRHLRLLAQHAFAMAAEVHVSGDAWQTTMEDGWQSTPSTKRKETAQELWGIGDTITELLDVMADTGSTHALNTARVTKLYRHERHSWAMQRRPTQ